MPETSSQRCVLYRNGALFDALERSLGAARQFIHFENYLWRRGALSRRMADVLSARARAGCRVRVLVDRIGARDMPAEAIDTLRRAGCAVALAGPLRQLWRLGKREHRKIVVVDGLEAFAGGHCITDAWTGEGNDADHHADLSLGLRGAAVAALAACFADSWVRATGEGLPPDELRAHGTAPGGIRVRIACAGPQERANSAQALYEEAIGSARERLWIQNPYVVPMQRQLRLLAAAARRGVDVRILTSSPSGTDHALVQYAARGGFSMLLRAGVRIFEHPRVLLHQKAFTVDRTWGAVGSANFDQRSFRDNLEIVLAVHDAALAGELDAFFLRYAGQSRELDLRTWSERPVLERVAERGALLLRGQL